MRKHFMICAVLLGVLPVLLFSSCKKDDPYYSSASMVNLSAAASKKEMPSLSSPTRIALLPDGNLMVSDYSRKVIFTIDSTDLSVIDAFETEGRPSGVAFADDRTFVGNESDGNVEFYDGKGKLRGHLGDGEGLVKVPSDIDIDEGKGLVFVVDTYDANVKVFDINGPLLSVIPAEGVSQEQLVSPTGITLDREREQVVVTDYGDPVASVPAKIKIYGYDGIISFTLSSSEVGSVYRFSRPQGITLDASGNFFMVDGMLGQVLVFDRVSKVGLKKLGEFGTGEGQLQLPLDAVLDKNTDNVYVTNNRPGRIEVFIDGGVLP